MLPNRRIIERFIVSSGLSLALLLCAPTGSQARSSGSHSTHSRSYAPRSWGHAPRARTYTPRTRTYTHHEKANPGVPRDGHGKIVRSESAKHDFMRRTGYPHGRPGYVVDHIIPLARGGADDPSNMEWQTIPDAKAKDKWELHR